MSSPAGDAPVNRVELLAPAGNFEKLEIAVHYGADAVYLAGKDFSLRNFSGNFTIAELREGVRTAHRAGVKVYVACNVYARNSEMEAISDYLRILKEIGPDALIVADPAIFMEANTTNYMGASFWEKLGIKRVNTARELTLKEIREIAEGTSLEIEAFAHGAMCISYSGRCLLSSFMAKRDSNRGMCCHPCRWKYTVMEEKRPGQYQPLLEDDRGTYIFNSKDLCMIGHIPEMIAAGITSLKIEGRMKGINYVATTVKVYREAIDAYYDDPEAYKVKESWGAELSKISSRGYSTGFYFGDPDQTVPEYDHSIKSSGYTFLGKIIETAGNGYVSLDVRNKIFKGEEIEVMTRKGPGALDTIKEIVDQNQNALSFAQPGSRVMLLLSGQYSSNDLLRKKETT